MGLDDTDQQFFRRKFAQKFSSNNVGDRLISFHNLSSQMDDLVLVYAGGLIRYAQGRSPMSCVKAYGVGVAAVPDEKIAAGMKSAP